MDHDELPTLLFRSNTPSEPVHMSGHAAEDLGIEEIASQFHREGIGAREVYEILAQPVADAATLRYRQDVFKDFRDNTELRNAFRDMLPRFDELANFSSARREADSPLQETIWRLGELELLVECVEKVYSVLTRPPAPESEALNAIAGHLGRMRTRNDYRSMREQLPELRRGLQYRKSISIGVNLDEKLRPVELAVLDIHDRPFAEQSLIGRLFGPRREFPVSSNVLTSPIPPEFSGQRRSRIPLAPLFQELEKLLGTTLRPIQRTLREYLKINTELFAGLRKEAAFFLGAVELAKLIETKGLPTCIPEVAETQAEEHLTSLYNLHLPLRHDHRDEKRSSIVLNSIEFSQENRFFVLTGPNQGGKTTFTQAVGIAHMFGQSGVFVPAAEATLVPADVIDTHFPTAEHGSLETGRLSDEASRLSEIVDTITPRSLVLLNESFTSTSPHEAVTLASELLQVLAHVGVRGVFATHLHDLAIRAHEFGCGIGALTAEAVVTDGSAQRTYRVREGVPEGNSFARDIAIKHGLSYGQMQRRLEERGIVISKHANSVRDQKSS